MGYTAEQIEKIAQKLRSMPEIEPPKHDYTKAEAVRMLSKEINALQKRGYSLDQIAQAIKGEGLDITTPTLKSYLYRSKAKKAAQKTKTEQNKEQHAKKIDKTVDASRATFEVRPDREVL